MGTFGHCQPAHYDHIQRRPQGLGDLEGHRDATPRQASNHNTLTAQMPQSRGQAPSRIGTIFETHGYPRQRRTADNPSLPPGRQRHQGRWSPPAGCRLQQQGEADGRRKRWRTRNTGSGSGPMGLQSGDGSQQDRAAGGTSCRDAPGPSPLGIKAVAARQGGKRSRCSRRSAGTAGAGSGRASRRGEGADHPLGEDVIRLVARPSDGSRRPLAERFQAKANGGKRHGRRANLAGADRDPGAVPTKRSAWLCGGSARCCGWLPNRCCSPGSS